MDNNNKFFLTLWQFRHLLLHFSISWRGDSLTHGLPSNSQQNNNKCSTLYWLLVAIIPPIEGMVEEGNTHVYIYVCTLLSLSQLLYRPWVTQHLREIIFVVIVVDENISKYEPIFIFIFKIKKKELTYWYRFKILVYRSDMYQFFVYTKVASPHLMGPFVCVCVCEWILSSQPVAVLRHRTCFSGFNWLT